MDHPVTWCRAEYGTLIIRGFKILSTISLYYYMASKHHCNHVKNGASIEKKCCSVYSIMYYLSSSIWFDLSLSRAVWSVWLIRISCELLTVLSRTLLLWCLSNVNIYAFLAFCLTFPLSILMHPLHPKSHQMPFLCPSAHCLAPK